MNPSTSFAEGLYSIMLRLYPTRFRAEFGQEMQEVFLETYESQRQEGHWQALQTIAQEIVHLPATVIYAVQWNNRRTRGTIMSDQPDTHIEEHLPDPLRQPASLPETLVGVGLFIILAVIFAIRTLLFSSSQPNEDAILNISLTLLIIIPAVGYIAGWVRGFPRWWYPFAGFFILYSVILSTDSLDGPELDRLLGSNVPGWTAWIPLLASTALGLLMTRSKQKYQNLIAGFRDLSFVNFAFLGGYPWYLYASLVDSPESSRLPTLIIANLIVILCAWIVLRSKRVIQRAAAIAGGFMIANAMLVWPGLVNGTSGFSLPDLTAVWVWLIISFVMLLPIIVMAVVSMIRKISTMVAG